MFLWWKQVKSQDHFYHAPPSTPCQDCCSLTASAYVLLGYNLGLDARTPRGACYRILAIESSQQLHKAHPSQGPLARMSPEE